MHSRLFCTFSTKAMHLTAPLYCGNIGYKGVDSLSDVICQTSIIANNKINIKELADMLQVFARGGFPWRFPARAT